MHTLREKNISVNGVINSVVFKALFLRKSNSYFSRLHETAVTFGKLSCEEMFQVQAPNHCCFGFDSVALVAQKTQDEKGMINHLFI